MTFTEQQPTRLTTKTYEALAVAAPYARGKMELHDVCKREESTTHPIHTFPDGSRLYRPLTFRENMQAQVDDYYTLKNIYGQARSLDQRTRLFTTRWLDSCTSIAYKGRTSQFTIISLDEQLLSLPADFSRSFIQTEYLPGPAVQLSSSQGKYNCPLREQEVLVHEGWLAAIEGDQHLLRECANIMFFLLQKRYAPGEAVGMAFYVDAHPMEDQKRSLSLTVSNLGSEPAAVGNVSLHCGGLFLRAVPASRV